MAIDMGIFARPRPLEKVGSSIWQDEWISRGMLAAHLDPASDAASRRSSSIELSCSWIDGRLARGARVLDLGCGPGLYAEDLARRGHTVVGVDFSARSIACARERAAAASLPIEYVEGDYLKLDLQGGFDCAMMIYCDLGTYGDEERDLLLHRIRKLLAPGGLLVFDVFSERYVELAREERRWEALGPGNFWSPEPCLALYEGFHFPEADAFCKNHIIIDASGSARQFRTWDRYYSEECIRGILLEEGFASIRVTRDLVPRSAFSPYETLFVEARAR